MKLKTYNTENCQSIRGAGQTPNVAFSKGIFRINKSAADLIGIKPGDFVEFHQDEDNEADWYIEKSSKGFKCREIKGGIMSFTSILLRNAIIESVGYEYASGRMPVAGKPTILDKRKLYAILTVALKNQ